MTNITEKLYKIRNAVTGLYSTGGLYPRWTKSGKTWKLGHLRTHLSQHLGHDFRPARDMSDWRIVEIEVREIATHPVHEILSQNQLLRMLKK